MDAKNLKFRYNDDPSTDEEVLDITGELVVPEPGTVVERKGKLWWVAQVTSDYARAVVLYHVFLTEDPARC